MMLLRPTVVISFKNIVSFWKNVRLYYNHLFFSPKFPGIFSSLCRCDQDLFGMSISKFELVLCFRNVVLYSIVCLRICLSVYLSKASKAFVEN